MKSIPVLAMTAVVALGLSACSKPDTTNTTSISETNTVVEESDANLSAVDGVATDNSVELDNGVVSNTTTNAL